MEIGPGIRRHWNFIRVRDFVAVADELSFTRAAAKLRVSQPSLTRKIRNLEAAIGVELFDRSKGHLEPTQAGRVFLGDAKRLLVLAAESIEEARRISLGHFFFSAPSVGQLNSSNTVCRAGWESLSRPFGLFFHRFRQGPSMTQANRHIT